jgi:hypothetical protein
MMWPSVANWMTAPQLYAWSSWPWLRGNAAAQIHPAPGRADFQSVDAACRPAAWTRCRRGGAAGCDGKGPRQRLRATEPAGFERRSDGICGGADRRAGRLTATAAPAPCTVLGCGEPRSV